jgi:hypothetical protein
VPILVVEAFAGSHPVARAAPAFAAAAAGGARICAYAGVELLQHRAPTAQEAGVDAAHYLCLGPGAPDGDVASPETQRDVAEFVARRLRLLGVGAVLVIGGPPCQSYSNASNDAVKFPARYALRDADRALRDALAARAAAAAAVEDLCARGGVGAAAGDSLSAAEAAAREARKRVEACQHAAAAAAEAAKAEAVEDAAKLQGADALVRAFLALAAAVESEARARGVPCYTVMENPYSSRDRGLWNR